jgi:hypothetical protein
VRVKRKRRRAEDWFLGLDLDSVLEEHEHTGDIDPVNPSQSGAEFEGRRHRRSETGEEEQESRPAKKRLSLVSRLILAALDGKIRLP